MKERKIVEIKGVPGFMDLNLDLTDTFKKYDAQTCREAEERQEKINKIRGYIDEQFYKWSMDKSFRDMSYDELLDFTQYLFKSIIEKQNKNDRK